MNCLYPDWKGLPIHPICVIKKYTHSNVILFFVKYIKPKYKKYKIKYNNNKKT